MIRHLALAVSMCVCVSVCVCVCVFAYLRVCAACLCTPTLAVMLLQMRWDPFPLPKDGEQVNFVQGLNTVAGAGDACMRSGAAIHVYACNASMERACYSSADGDMLIGGYDSACICVWVCLLAA